jgi:hypothetical protein
VLVGYVAAVVLLGLAGFLVVQRGDPTKAAPPVAPTPSRADRGEGCGPPPEVPDLSADALHDKVLDELDAFVDWLEADDAQGFIGEVGWPASDPGWSSLADAWYAAASDAGLWVTAWATGSWWGAYDLGLYEFEDCGLRPTGAGAVMERHRGTGRGVNVNGGEFGIGPNLGTGDGGSFSNRSPGTLERDYRYEDAEFFEELAVRGVEFVRLPFRWERIQPMPGDELDPGEVAALRRSIRAAGNAGLTVVPTAMNYGAYWLAERPGAPARRVTVGEPEVTVEHFANLWRRLAEALGDLDAVTAWGLMNEPTGFAGGAQSWESASQRAVDAIRDTGDRRTVAVALYDWSSVPGAREVHPRGPWIRDQLGPVRYEAHHYFDASHTGDYDRSYDEERAAAAAGG